MTTPEFRAPQRRPRRQLSPEQAERRYRYLDTIDRRCDAHSRKCITAANVIIDAVLLKQDNTKVSLKSCTRHKRQFLFNPDTYQILAVKPLPPGEQISRAQRDKLI